MTPGSPSSLPSRHELLGLFFLATPCVMQDLSSPYQGLNWLPLQWKQGILTTGPPGSPKSWFSMPWTFLPISCAPSRPLQEPPLMSLPPCAQPCRTPQESSSLSSGPPSGWIILASIPLATNCQTVATGSWFRIASTCPCTPQGYKSWSSYPLWGQVLPAFTFLHSLKYLINTDCAYLQVLTACWGRTMLNKRITKLILVAVF